MFSKGRETWPIEDQHDLFITSRMIDRFDDDTLWLILREYLQSDKRNYRTMLLVCHTMRNRVKISRDLECACDRIIRKTLPYLLDACKTHTKQSLIRNRPSMDHLVFIRGGNRNMTPLARFYQQIAMTFRETSLGCDYAMFTDLFDMLLSKYLMVSAKNADILHHGCAMIVSYHFKMLRGEDVSIIESMFVNGYS